jgi:hypothetical protein
VREKDKFREIGRLAAAAQLPLAVRTDGTLDFAAVTRRAHMMGVARVPGVGVGVWVACGAVAVSQCVQLVVVKADRGRRQ